MSFPIQRTLTKSINLAIIKNHILSYPASINLNYAWCFGSTSGLFIVIQILSGFFLSTHYIPDTLEAFNSIQYIMRDIQSGWFLHYCHQMGASFIFLFIYLHMGRSLYIKSPNEKSLLVFITGILIFILLMATAFLGYVLPWGQMSFWGATVITNLVSILPIYGKTICFWLWGGFSVSSPTLTRFYVIHFVLPFIILGLAALHLTVLHIKGSSSITNNKVIDVIPLFPYLLLKDFFFFFIALFFLFIFIFFYPKVLLHSENYNVANSLVTPLHIMPEWYFLPFYAILRSIPNKVGGFFFMYFSIKSLLYIALKTKFKKFNLYLNFFFYNNLIYHLNYYTFSTKYYLLKSSYNLCDRLLNNLNLYKFMYLSKENNIVTYQHKTKCVLFFNIFVFLGFIGMMPVRYPFISLGQFLTFLYFLFVIQL